MDPRDDSEYGYSDDWTSVDGEYDGARTDGPGWAGSAQPIQYASDAGLDGPAERSGNRLATAGTVAPSAERAMAAHSLSARGPETVNTVHGSAGESADDGAPRFGSTMNRRRSRQAGAAANSVSTLWSRTASVRRTRRPRHPRRGAG